jgi:ABC-type phosphate transport system substrate-binding protein
MITIKPGEYFDAVLFEADDFTDMCIPEDGNFGVINKQYDTVDQVTTSEVSAIAYLERFDAEKQYYLDKAAQLQAQLAEVTPISEEETCH